MRLIIFAFAASTALVAGAAAAQTISTTGNPMPAGDGFQSGAIVRAGPNSSGNLAASGNTGVQSPTPVQTGTTVGGGDARPQSGPYVYAGAPKDGAGAPNGAIVSVGTTGTNSDASRTVSASTANR